MTLLLLVGDVVSSIFSPLSLSILLCLSALLWWGRKSTYKLPPGPLSLPIVGTLALMNADQRQTLYNLAMRYGDMVTLYLGPRRVVMLNSFRSIKEAVSTFGHATSGRPQEVFWMKDMTQGKGIATSQGDTWQHQRKVVSTFLGGMGPGRASMEDTITQEAIHLLAVLEKVAASEEPPGRSLGDALDGKGGDVVHGGFDPRFLVLSATANIIHTLVFGQRRNYEDPVLVRLVKLVSDFFDIAGGPGLLHVFPFLRHLPVDIFRYKVVKDSYKHLRAEIVSELEGRLKHPLPEEPRNYIDFYRKTMANERKEGLQSNYTADQLVASIFDLFGGGLETTASTLSWGIIYMVHYPEVQKRVQAEIDDIIGQEDLPTASDRKNMPYTEACLNELQRIADVILVPLPRSLTEDTAMQGYTIPKGTTIMFNTHFLHHDPAYWPDPNHFNPNRFLDDEGRLRRRDSFLPFSTGKRSCVGEVLARLELFIFFTSLLQRFSFGRAPGRPLPDLNGDVHFAHTPKPFQVLITRRR